MTDLGRRRALIALCALLGPATAQAQMQHHHPAAADTAAHGHAMPAPPGHAGMGHGGTSQSGTPAAPPSHGGMAMHEHMAGMHMTMAGLYGPYAMSREASGTSWQPEMARHQGVHGMRGPWSTMIHGFAEGVYDDQGGDRGDTDLYGDNMGMAIAQRPLGPGTLGLRAMLSLEPATIGKEGYPLLLQTGETADGRTPLLDRQHPHDLFMELAGSYRLAAGDRSLFVYGGLPGEPALGPPAFMHRFSGRNAPVAPITHHWLDSTHIVYGVLTAGAVLDRVKVEASAFRGREPDENRWNIETPKLDSHAFRLSVNPSDRWALQVSYGRLHSPEQLEPEVDQDRTTASVMYDGTWGEAWRWEGTAAWGRNRNRPGHLLDAFAAEAAAALGERHTFFARAEQVEKDELALAPDPLAGRVFEVGELTAGYRCDFWHRDHLAVGLGVAGTLVRIPRTLRAAYGEAPTAGLIFLRAGIE